MVAWQAFVQTVILLQVYNTTEVATSEVENNDNKVKQQRVQQEQEKRQVFPHLV